MSTPQDTIQADLKTSMRARDAERTGCLRLLLTELKNERIKTGEELDDDGFARVVKRLVKQRRDAAEQFRAGDREEMAAKEEREVGILQAYLPQQASEQDIRSAIEEFLAAEGLAGPKAMGPVMQAMTARFGATADGGTISRIARSLLVG